MLKIEILILLFISNYNNYEFKKQNEWLPTQMKELFNLIQKFQNQEKTNKFANVNATCERIKEGIKLKEDNFETLVEACD